MNEIGIGEMKHGEGSDRVGHGESKVKFLVCAGTGMHIKKNHTVEDSLEISRCRRWSRSLAVSWSR